MYASKIQASVRIISAADAHLAGIIIMIIIIVITILIIIALTF
jgi:hypothetical protein